MVNQDIEINSKILLENLGSDLLTKIERSKDPLSFGYKRQGERLIVMLTPKKVGDDHWRVSMTIYRQRRWLASRLVPIDSKEFDIQVKAHPREKVEDIVSKSLADVSQETLEAMLVSKEPLTFTLLSEDHDKQVEVGFTRNGRRIDTQVYID